jgi:uncharacterized membrane protein YjjB (DUF3815 family)
VIAPWILELADAALWAGITSFGFSLIFRVPRRLLPACVLLGAAGYACRAGLLASELVGLEAATLVAAAVIGLAAHAIAKRRDLPVMAFALPAVIAMVPGSYAFRAMLDLLRLVSSTGPPSPALAASTLEAFGHTVLVLAAIVVGVGLPSLGFGTRPKKRQTTR